MVDQHFNVKRPVVQFALFAIFVCFLSLSTSVMADTPVKREKVIELVGKFIGNNHTTIPFLEGAAFETPELVTDDRGTPLKWRVRIVHDGRFVGYFYVKAIYMKDGNLPFWFGGPGDDGTEEVRGISAVAAVAGTAHAQATRHDFRKNGMKGLVKENTVESQELHFMEKSQRGDATFPELIEKSQQAIEKMSTAIAPPTLVTHFTCSDGDDPYNTQRTIFHTSHNIATEYVEWNSTMSTISYTTGIDFYDHTGTFYWGASTTISSGEASWTWWAGIYISGQYPETNPGTWSAQVLLEGTVQVTDNFTIADVIPPTLEAHFTCSDGTDPYATQTAIFSATDILAAEYAEWNSSLCVRDWSWRIEFYDETNTYYWGASATIPSGNTTWTGWGGIYINGSYPETHPGTWNAQVSLEGNVQATDYFDILGAAPLPPILASPPDGAINQPTTLNLSWNAATDADSYGLQVDDDQGFGSPEFDQSEINGTLQGVGPLAEGRTYYWRANATNAGGTSDWSDVWNFTTVTATVCQEILIDPDKLNMISFNVEPSDYSIDVMLSSLSTLLVATDDEGQFYIPPYGVNNIGPVDPTNGYRVFISGGGAEVVTNDGYPMNPAVYGQTLDNSQIYMIGYPYQIAHPVVDVFAAIAGNVVVMQDDMGQFWIPGYGINTLGNMLPGKGYQIFVNTPVSFTYPMLANRTAKAPLLAREAPRAVHFRFTQTGIPYAVVVTESQAELLAGDEIAVYAGAHCVGAAVFEGRFPFAVAAWEGDDEYELPGFTAGQSITFKVWRALDNREYAIDTAFASADEALFRGGPISVASLGPFDAKGAIPRNYALDQNYPNPFNPTTKISYHLPEAGEVTLAVYSVEGKLIRQLFAGFREAGSFETVWNGRDEAGHIVAGGIYFYRLRAADFSDMKKLVFVK